MVEAMIKTILMGLQIVLCKGFLRIVVESDSMLAVKFIQIGCFSQHPYF